MAILSCPEALRHCAGVGAMATNLSESSVPDGTGGGTAGAGWLGARWLELLCAEWTRSAEDLGEGVLMPLAPLCPGTERASKPDS